MYVVVHAVIDLHYDCICRVWFATCTCKIKKPALLIKSGRVDNFCVSSCVYEAHAATVPQATRT